MPFGDDHVLRSPQKAHRELFEFCDVKVDFSAVENIRVMANKKAKKVSADRLGTRWQLFLT